ncbi:diguanylate cyclase, partial [Streptomyces sp. SID5926]|nr:diguanylate cyclase [Streptomyces sp. SID5926]
MRSDRVRDAAPGRILAVSPARRRTDEVGPMTTGAENTESTARMPGRLTALLIDASTRAIDAAGGRVGGVYLRSPTPGLLRLAVLAGLPGPLFRPWWRLHADSPFPVADAYRLGVRVVLPNAAETMRRYPQFAAGL